MNNSVYGKTIKEKINAKWNGKETKKLFQKLPSKSQIKGLKNIDLLHELPFYDQLSIYEMTKAFK